MIVPPNALPSPYQSPANDDQQKPSQAQLLMAAAEMQKLGRLSGQINNEGKMGHGGFYTPQGVTGEGWMDSDQLVKRYEGKGGSKRLNLDSFKGVP